MNRVSQPSNAGGNDQDKDMNTPHQDIVLLSDPPNNTNKNNDNNTATINILTNNNMIQSSRAGLISSSPLDSNLPIYAISESEVRMSASERVGFNLPAPPPHSPPLSGLSNVLPSRPINIINPIFYLSNKRDPPFIGIPSCEGRRGLASQIDSCQSASAPSSLPT